MGARVVLNQRHRCLGVYKKINLRKRTVRNPVANLTLSESRNKFQFMATAIISILDRQGDNMGQDVTG